MSTEDHAESAAPEASEAPPAPPKGGSAGAGLLAITGAKVYFILTSFGIQLALPRLLGDPRIFGQYGTLMAAVSILDNILIAATIQSVSKFVSEDDSRAPGILRQGLQIQLVVGGVLSASLFTAAPLFAQFHGDPALGPMMRVASAVVFSYALYAALVGNLNGRRAFTRQAGLDISFSTLRTIGIVGGAAMGIGALGAVSGFAAAAVGILVVALVVVGTGKTGQRLPLRTWLTFMAPIWLYQGCLNGILQLDIQVLSRTLSELGQEAGQTAIEAAAFAQTQVGFYRAAQIFAFVPYQLILSMTFVVFPLVSKATASGDHEAAKRTVRGSIRFSALALLSIACPIAGASDGVMRIAFPEEYLAGAPALGILVMGIAAFALFVISATMLSGAGKPGTAAGIAGTGLIVVIVANYVFVRAAGLDDALRAAALGTSAGTLVALALAAGGIYLRFGAFLPIPSVIRGAIAGAAGYFAAQAIPHGGPIMSVVALAGGFFAFLAALAVTREVTGADLRAARTAVGR